jgi:hypothetical protein
VKGPFAIGGAIILGGLIILCSLAVKNSADAEQTGSVIVARAPVRTPIVAKDLDNNGIEDWQESLQERVYKTIDTPTTTFAIDLSEPYTPPETFTGKFSEAFFKDYMEGKVNGQDFSDPSALVGTAVEAIEINTQSKRHNRLELNIVPTTPESIRAYGNRVAEIMKTHSIENEPETHILQNALEANDPKMLSELEPIRNVYVKTIADTLTMEVPDIFADMHVDLLNANEAIELDISAMQVAFTDPLYSLARVKSYRNDAKALFESLSAIREKTVVEGISYGNEEPGAILYLFKI